MLTLPHDDLSERTIAGLLLCGMQVEYIFGELQADDLYSPKYRAVFEAALAVRAAGAEVNVLTIRAELERTERLKNLGGMDWLLEVNGSIASEWQVDAAVAYVRDMALLRKGYTVIGKAQSDFLVTGHRAEELIADLQGELASLQGRKSGGVTLPAAEVMMQAVDRLEAQHGKGTSCGVEVGYSALDYMLSGLQKGELILLAARPSMGKTSLMMNMAVNAAKRGAGVYVFSIEMTAREIGHRMIFTEATIDGNLGRHGELDAQQMAEVGRAASRLSALPLWVNDRSRKLYDIISVAKREASVNKIDLICLDYIQLVRTNLQGKSRNDEVGFITGELKALAKELNVPMLALSQLSRVNESAAAPRPTLNALRDSGSLEQDADVVVFLHSDEYYSRFLSGEKDLPEWKADVIVAKQRNGPTGTVKMEYKRQFTRFYEVDTRQPAAPPAVPDWYVNN